MIETFNDREKGFENKFAHDAEMQFRAPGAAQTERLLGPGPASMLRQRPRRGGRPYAMEVVRADFAEVGHEDVYRKLSTDLDHRADEITIRSKMAEFLGIAKEQLLSEPPREGGARGYGGRDCLAGGEGARVAVAEHRGQHHDQSEEQRDRAEHQRQRHDRKAPRWRWRWGSAPPPRIEVITATGTPDRPVGAADGNDTTLIASTTTAKTKPTAQPIRIIAQGPAPGEEVPGIGRRRSTPAGLRPHG